jgi:hypothetical protein
MTAFFGSSYYCHDCKTTFNNKDKHKCKKENKECKCKVCNGKTHSSEVTETPKWLNCNKCLRWF